MFEIIKELLGLCLAAFLPAYLVGRIYYSPNVCGELWRRNSNRPPSKADPTILRMRCMLFNLVSAVVLSKVIGVPANFLSAVIRSVAVSLLGTGALLHNYTFTDTPFALFAIDALYNIISTTVMGTTLYYFHTPELLAYK